MNMVKRDAAQRNLPESGQDTPPTSHASFAKETVKAVTSTPPGSIGGGFDRK